MHWIKLTVCLSDFKCKFCIVVYNMPATLGFHRLLPYAIVCTAPISINQSNDMHASTSKARQRCQVWHQLFTTAAAAAAAADRARCANTLYRCRYRVTQLTVPAPES